MDIWLDSTNLLVVDQAVQLGLLSGVTTNPTLIAQSKKEFKGVLKDLLNRQEGPVTAQVVSEDVEEMVRQGEDLYAFSNRLIIKVPLTTNGVKAIHLLSSQEIPTMATAIFHPHQALLAALAGANYVAPYLSRLELAGEDPWIMLKKVSLLFQTYQLNTKILGASLQTIEQVMSCAEIGIYGVTIKEELFEKLIKTDPLTLKAVEQFEDDWKSTQTKRVSRKK